MARQTLRLLSAPYQSGRDWYRVREDAISFPRARSRKGSKGPRSLVDMSLRVLADNIDSVSYDTLKGISEETLRKLFKEVLARNMSLRVWDVLSNKIDETCQEEKSTRLMAMRRYCQEIVDPPCELSAYTSPLGALSDCLVHLCIDNVARFERHELLTLAKLENLAVLELIDHGQSTAIDDRLVRGWQEVGGNGLKPFPSLRVLKITSRWHAISPSSLDHILEFPRLEIFDIAALPAARWRKVRSGEGYVWIPDTAWNLTEPKGSLLASYARAYLDGFVAVNPDIAERLRSLFEDDRQEVVLVEDPRAVIYRDHCKWWEGEKERLRQINKRLKEEAWKENAWKRERERENEEAAMDDRDLFEGYGYEEEDDEGVDEEEEEGDDDEEEEDEDVDLSDYLDNGWRAVLKGSHPLSAPTDAQQAANLTDCKGDMTDDQVFWFLALLDQQEYDARNSAIQPQVEGVTVCSKRFASLRLRSPANTGTHSRELLNADRLIFSRDRGEYLEREVELELVRSEKKRESGTVLPILALGSWMHRQPEGPEERRGKKVVPSEEDQGVEEHEGMVTSRTSVLPTLDLGLRIAPRPKRPEERRENDLKPRKRQKMGDLLSLFQP